jgi:hypothetical protein
MSTLLCLLAGLLIVICCWFLTDPDCIQIYEEEVTEKPGAIDYVPASVARQLETELATERARLDWLLARNPYIQMMSHKGPISASWEATYSDRTAIDASMKEDSK